MGCFNALLAAAAGYDTVIYDVSDDALAKAPDTLMEMAPLLSEEGFFPGVVLQDLVSSIGFSNDLAGAIANADLISESVPERLQLKRDIHQRLDEISKPGALLTTNTSSLPVSEIEDAVGRGDRFAALHSHLGAVVFDIVAGPRTAQATVDTLVNYVHSLGGWPLVLKKENPGYVINAMLGALLTVSQMLVIEGVATKEDIDRAWMRNQAAPIGPFGLMDLFGLNVIFDSWQHPKPQNAHLQEKILDFITPYIESGELGTKTGRGFYSYPEPQYAQPDFLAGDSDLSFIYRVMSNVLVANAIVIAANEVAEPLEIDRAWMISFKLSRGPFGTLDKLGLDDFLDSYRELASLGIVPQDPLPALEAYLGPLIDNNRLGTETGQGIYSYPGPAYEA